MRGIAWLVARSDVAYQSYFDADSEMLQFFNSPRSIRAYAAAFDAHRVSVKQSLDATQALEPPRAPSLQITRGPAYGSTVDSGEVSFDFAAQPGLRPSCSLDGAPYAPCSSGHDDALSGLSKGVHEWTVQLSNSTDLLSTNGRVFVVR